MKIDTSKIQGFDEMSAEEKLQALLSYEVEQDFTGYVKKELFDKTSSEMASVKKQLKERMSEEEIANAERQKEFDAMKSELEKFKYEKQVSETKASYLSLGYDDELATKSAKALLDGDTKALFECQKTYQETLLQNERANALSNTPKPQSIVSGGETITREQFNAMSYNQQVELYQTNPDLFNSLSKGE